jgi:hypothetical protein
MKLSRVRKEQRKLKRERIHNSYRYLHKIAWVWTSRLVRLTGVDDTGMNRCYTCDRLHHWKQLQAGHFHHDKLDFDTVRNLRPQDVYCNKNLRGNGAIFGTKLMQELGVDGMIKLLYDSYHTSYNIVDLKKIIEENKKKVEEILKARHLSL